MPRKGRKSKPKKEGKEEKGNPIEVQACESAVFFLILDDLLRSYARLMKEILAMLSKILREEADEDSKKFEEVKGKLYTAKGGTFMVKIKPSEHSPPEDHVSLLYRWSDLYFEAFHSRGKWFQFSDAQEPLPPRSQLYYHEGNEGVEKLPLNSSYASLGGYNIRMGIESFKICYTVLMKATDFVKLGRYNKFAESGALSLAVVAVSESLRFVLFQSWILEMLAKEDWVQEYIPTKYTRHFNSWENKSSLMFKAKPPKGLSTMMGVLKRSSRVEWPPASNMDITEKMRSTMDFYERAKRQEEAPLIEQVYQKRLEEEEILYYQEQMRKIELSKKHAFDLQQKKRLSRMLEHKNAFQKEVVRRREVEFSCLKEDREKKISQLISSRKHERERVRKLMYYLNLEESRIGRLDEEEEASKREDENLSVYVGNLSPSTSVFDLEKVFQAFGRIKPDGVMIESSKESGVFFGFVEFEDMSSTQNALSASPIELNGSLVHVEKWKLGCGFPCREMSC